MAILLPLRLGIGRCCYRNEHQLLYLWADGARLSRIHAADIAPLPITYDIEINYADASQHWLPDEDGILSHAW